MQKIAVSCLQKVAVFGLCLSLLVFSSIPGSGAEQQVVTAYKILQPSVVGIDSESAFGSGMVVDGAGYILTCYHVIEDEDFIKVNLHDRMGESLPARVVAIDEDFDLALLKVRPSQSVTPVIWGDSDNLEVGEGLVAVSDSDDYGQSVVAGILSGINRKITINDALMLQTDCPVNFGNSGGVLATLNGQVIGIIQSKAKGLNGVSFAVPVNLAKKWVATNISADKVEEERRMDYDSR